MHIGIIANPRAGHRGSLRVLPGVQRFAARWARIVTTEVASAGRRIEEIASAMATSVDVILVVGGDGTLNGVVNGLGRLPGAPPIAFVPAGRGKDTSRSLPSLTRADFGRDSVTWRYELVDLGEVTTADGNSRRFVNICSLGLGATAARIAGRLPRIPGIGTYVIGAGAGLIHDPEVTVRLRSSDGIDTELKRCRLVAVANGRYFGGGLQIAPMACASDGLLDVVAVSGAGRTEILRQLPSVYRGTHMTHPAVHHWTATSIIIDSPRPIGVETDGEVVGTTPATLSVLPGAIRWAVLA